MSQCEYVGVEINELEAKINEFSFISVLWF